jgi:rubrerythrin
LVIIGSDEMSILRCLVCGVEIKSEHIYINKNSRLTDNTLSDILFCPFCGVSNNYIKDTDKPYFNEIGELDEESNIILDHAMKLEVFNSDFYKKAEIMARNDEVRGMFKDLSKVELTHAIIHMRAGNFKKIPKLADINYSRLSSDELLIKEAINREKHAVAYYEKYVQRVKNVKLREILLALREVEREHISLGMGKLK